MESTEQHPAKPLDPADLKLSFSGSDNLSHRYGQADQDVFVLSATDGRRKGRYLEIGCGWPFYINNTALLETHYDWQGVSIDTSACYTDTWPGQRRNPAVMADARRLDAVTVLQQHGITETDLDYLSLDCDPAAQSLSVLQWVPLHRLRFAVITFEHDCYCDGVYWRDQSRELLQRHGYELVVPNVAMWQTTDPLGGFEDWWIHPDLVSQNRRDLLKSEAKSVNFYLEYLYRK